MTLSYASAIQVFSLIIGSSVKKNCVVQKSGPLALIPP